ALSKIAGFKGRRADARRRAPLLKWAVEMRLQMLAGALCGPPLTATASTRLRHDADIGLRRFPPVGIDLLRLLVADRAGDDDVLALLPVGGGRNAMLRGQLQRVDGAQDLLEIAPGAHRIDQHQLDLLVRADDEDV